ncbi:MAG: DNA primase [Candidatus Paceibacterota bacterium]
MSSDIEKIKERLNIVDVVGSYMKLQKAGSNLKANCPFHNEKTPSFFVSPSRNMYHCFGCGAKGDIFTFVQEFESLDFSGALKLLASRAGVVIKQENKKDRDEENQMFTILEEATRFFENNIKRNAEALEYLKKRGVSENTIDNFRIGFALNGWRNLYDHLKKEGFDGKMMFDAGLVRKTEKGFYDYFRDRIMFPIFDSADRVVAFSGRILGKENENTPKYINSPETKLYNKSQILYGYNKAKHSMRKNNFCILVEGQMDLILSHQSGFANTVALSGTALTDYHLNLIKKLTKNLVISLDSDDVGIASSKKGSELAISAGMDVKIAELSSKDPAEIILKNKDDWREIIKKSKHAIDFFVDFIEKRNFPQRKFWKEIREKILPMVAKIENKIDQSHFIHSISTKTEIPEDSLKEELTKAKNDIKKESDKYMKTDIGKNKEKTKNDSTEQTSKIEILKKKIKGLILWQKSIDESSIDVKKISSRIEKILGENIFDKTNEKNDLDLIFDAEMNYLNIQNILHELEELILLLEEETLKEKLKQVMNDMKKAEKENDSDVEKYLDLCNKLSKEIQNKKEEREKVYQFKNLPREI